MLICLVVRIVKRANLKVRDFSHELYNAGHMYEAAVAHYQATDSKSFLNIAIKNADLIYQRCIEEGENYYPGHQENELGLIKLYRVTGKDKYLKLAKLFLDRRGRGYRDAEEDGELAELVFDAYSTGSCTSRRTNGGRRSFGPGWIYVCSDGRHCGNYWR